MSASPARDDREPRWFWATLTLSSLSIVAVVFAAWELMENRFFSQVDYVTLHYLYISRGIVSSLLLAAWAAWYVLRQRRRSEQELRRSWERYRGLLEASPGAVVLYDEALRVSEWNRSAERLYGYDKTEALGAPLPTVPPDRQAELHALLERVRSGQAALGVETRRCGRGGTCFDVELNLLPFREGNGQLYILEVGNDIRERVKLRQTLLEVEKLTSMGKMAAGTAHHLNTPLAAMLLRVQMMRERAPGEVRDSDLERLEAAVSFCQGFVRRLLEFSRRPAAQKRPEDVARTIESVATFLEPSLRLKHGRLELALAGAHDVRVLGDRNLLEALFSILLYNALDAIDEHGTIALRCRRGASERVEIEVADDGCGVAPEHMTRIFEPFFTTKEPGKGTGLGLAIARNIVREHGGSLRLESVVGEGTRVLLELPVHDERAAGSSREASVTAEVPA